MTDIRVGRRCFSTFLLLLSDLPRSLVYSYAHSERPAERARIGLRRRSRAAKFPSAGLIFGIIIMPRREGAIRIAAAKQISRAGNW